MIYAYREDTSDLKHHTGTGSFAIQIHSNGDVTEVKDEEPTPFEVYHGFLMWTSWGLLGLFQLITNRYMKVFWKFNRLLHALSGILMLIITLTMGILGIQHSYNQILVGWHYIMGFIVLCLVSLIVIGGIMNSVILNTLRWKT